MFAYVSRTDARDDKRFSGRFAARRTQRRNRVRVIVARSAPTRDRRPSPPGPIELINAFVYVIGVRARHRLPRNRFLRHCRRPTRRVARAYL